MRIFIDSNVPMYVAGRDHPNKVPATRILERVRSGQWEGCTSTEVLQEILYRYLALERPQLAFEVYDLVVAICPVVLPVTLADTDRARSMLEHRSELGVRDAMHAAVALHNDIETIASFDLGFDGIPEISRVFE